MSISTEKIKPLEFFNFAKKKNHFYEALNATFLDSDNIISKNYKIIKIKNHKNSDNNNNIYNDKIDEQLIDESFKSLLNSKRKMEYLRYLMIEYTLSQPNNLNDLLDNYYSLIFPYYLFLLKYEVNDDLCYLILDYINFSIIIFDEKNTLKNNIELNAIIDIVLFLNQIEIEVSNYKEKIIIIPYINTHIELIYSLILFMVIIKKKEDKFKNENELKKENEINENVNKRNLQIIDEKKIGTIYFINQFDISKLRYLSNDSFVPRGIIKSTYISFEMNKNANDRFLLLGRRYIYVYKSDLLKELNNIIPLIAGFTIIDCEDIYQKIRIKVGNRDFTFYIYEKKEFNEFREKLFDVIEGNYDDDIINNDDIIKCSKAFYDDKVMGGIFENTPFYEKNQKILNI